MMINWLLALINKRQGELFWRNRVLEQENAMLRDEVGRLNAKLARRKKRPFHFRFLNK